MEAAFQRLDAAFTADETTWLNLSASRIAAARACDALIRAEGALISDETEVKEAGALFDAVDALFLRAEGQRQQARMSPAQRVAYGRPLSAAYLMRDSMIFGEIYSFGWRRLSHIFQPFGFQRPLRAFWRSWKRAIVPERPGAPQGRC